MNLFVIISGLEITTGILIGNGIWISASTSLACTSWRKRTVNVNQFQSLASVVCLVLHQHSLVILLTHCYHHSECWHDDVIKWQHFLRYWPFVREFTGHRWIPLTKASDAELWCFLGWVNNGDAGDLRRYRAHYNVIVMTCFLWWYIDMIG